MNGYPKYFLTTLLITCSLLWLSGIALYPSFAMFKLEWEYDWLLDSSLSQGTLRQSMTVVHAISGWFILLLIGAIWTIHMRNHWRRKENRQSGVDFTILWAVLVITALGIYYFGNPDLSYSSAVIHALLGGLMPLLLWLHRYQGKKSIKKSVL